MKTTKLLVSGAVGFATLISPLAVFAEGMMTSDSVESSDQVTQGGGPGAEVSSDEQIKGGVPGKKIPQLYGSNDGRMMAEPTSGGMRGDVKEQREATLKAHGDLGIEKRLTSLAQLEERINAMKNLSDDQKTEILSTLTAQKSELSDLKVKIAGDTSTTTLKADLESISKAHRTYRLVIPTTAITAAAGRVTTIVSQMEIFAAKIDARIVAIKADGKDATSAETAYADFKIKIADAKVQADAAVTLVANLPVDNGDSTVAEANNTALKSAKAKLELANKDLKDARKDIGVILKGVRGLGIRAEGEASTTTTVQ